MPGRPSPPRRDAIGFADGPIGISHSVTEEAFAEGARSGGYVALCGTRVLPTRFTASARYHCPACEWGV